MTRPSSQSLASSPKRRSIAIVGGGIAGLYAAYMLGRLGQDVQVFEVSPDHWGGRIESCSFDLGDGHAFIAEFGPMRFETDLQQRLRSLCFHLGIDFEPFSPTSAPIGTTPGIRRPVRTITLPPISSRRMRFGDPTSPRVSGVTVAAFSPRPRSRMPPRRLRGEC